MKPFPARKRNLILIFGAIVFICLIPFLILSAMGYKLNIGSAIDSGSGEGEGKLSSILSMLSIEKTGGIYIRSDLFGTVAFINEEEFTDRGLLSRNIFAQNLIPGTYTVKVEKEGYRDWSRSLKVSPNKVTEAYLFTLPEEIIFTEIPQYLDQDGMPTTTPPLSKNSSKLILQNPEYKSAMQLFMSTTTATTGPKTANIKNAAKISATTSSTTLANIEIEKTKLYGEEITRNLYATSTVRKITFTWDGSYDQTPYYFCEFEVCKKQVDLNLPENIEKFYLFPNRDDIAIVEFASGVYYVDISGSATNLLEPLYVKPKASVIVRGGEIFIKDGTKLFLMSY